MKTLSLTVSSLCLWVALFLTGDGQSQSLESGVVKVSAKGEGTRKTGTGFIVRLSEDQVYIMTAAHVVEGDSQPEIEFFTRRNAAVTARIVELEGGDDLRGLALLVVSGRTNLPSGLQVPPLAPSFDVKGGDSVTAIGFPRMAGPWALIRGSIVSRQGRDIIFDGAIDEGNSGGPLIKDGQVVGLITGLSGRFGRATPSTVVRLFIEGSGVEPGQITQPAVRAAPSSNSTGESVTSISLTSRYPEGAEGLKKLIEDITKLLRAGDTKAATALVEGLARFDFGAWFERVFGEQLGATLATALKGMDSPLGVSNLVQTFSEQVRQGRTVVQVQRFTGQDNDATGYQNRAMAQMKRPEPIYSVRLLEPGQSLGYHMYNFIYAQGGFRLVGKMQLPPEFDKNK